MVGKSRSVLIFLSLATLALPAGALGNEASWLTGIIHVHSNFSSGSYSIEELAGRAESVGADFLILTDHDLAVMAYGLQPFQKFLKKKYEKRSIISQGPEVYLTEIARVNAGQKAVLIIPGVQSTPHYFWQGSLLTGNLTSINARREVLILGLDRAEQYRNLPIVHNPRAYYRLDLFQGELIFFALASMAGLVLLFNRPIFKVLGLGVILLCLAGTLNSQIRVPYPFDQYHDFGYRPYQVLLDYVAQNGGLSFWAHPESVYAERGVSYGPITMRTAQYPAALIRTNNYTGFEAVYGDKNHLREPGREWDAALLGYINGLRQNYPVAIAGSDYHSEGMSETKFNEFKTVVRATGKSKAEILAALQAGRVYALRQLTNYHLILETFKIIGSEGQTADGPGSTIESAGPVQILARVTFSDHESREAAIQLISNGREIKKITGKTPLDFSYNDTQDPPGATVYYRLNVSSTAGLLTTNPIFVSFPPQADGTSE